MKKFMFLQGAYKKKYKAYFLGFEHNFEFFSPMTKTTYGNIVFSARKTHQLSSKNSGYVTV